AMAVASSFKNRPIDDKMAAFGEIGLSGEVRSVSMIEQRIQEAARLGYTTCMIPKVCEKQLKNVKDVKIIGVSSVQDAISSCLSG
ncbi:MAG: DNA repair protein RadA, partial [Lachnospiraceae bacterium]|nr:DNA repair protein RadA [Lachnospiraceae bacterium]